MFDIGASELLVIVIIAIIVIGPKQLPLALRTAGRWIGKIRRVSTHFRTGLDAMVREAEMEDMDRKWKEQNDAIMAKYPAVDSADPASAGIDDSDQMTPIVPPEDSTHGGESGSARESRNEPEKTEASDEPSLPFDGQKNAG
ncbi:Sec-independent protein translocase protein TatB [Altererythrobacter sp. MF3-039]|uniref:Sec-independent protein translocase protein TatB n=1 Tax=Altererythrobacter sp. MF3-039 TaxID=3252901 RepID=UPI00390C667D